MLIAVTRWRGERLIVETVNITSVQDEGEGSRIYFHGGGTMLIEETVTVLCDRFHIG